MIKIGARCAHLVTILAGTAGHLVLRKSSLAKHVVTHAGLVRRHHAAHGWHLILTHHASVVRCVRVSTLVVHVLLMARRAASGLILHKIGRASHVMLVLVLVAHATAVAATTATHLITTLSASRAAASSFLLVVPRPLRRIVHFNRAAENSSTIHLVQRLL